VNVRNARARACPKDARNWEKKIHVQTVHGKNWSWGSAGMHGNACAKSGSSECRGVSQGTRSAYRNHIHKSVCMRRQNAGSPMQTAYTVEESYGMEMNCAGVMPKRGWGVRGTGARQTCGAEENETCPIVRDAAEPAEPR